MLSVKTILHPTDFSPNAEHAFLTACSLAKDYKARLILLHVTAPIVSVLQGAGAQSFETCRIPGVLEMEILLAPAARPHY